MKPAPFDYQAPATVAEATALLAEYGDEAKVLAGGQSLVPMLNLRLTRFEALVDLGRIDRLRTVEHDDRALTIGATVRQCDVEESAVIARTIPLLAEATPLIGHFQIRSRGTVGGSIAHADPAAEYPAVALALDAEIEVAGPRETCTVGAADFFTGTWSTVLEPDELLVSVRFPCWHGQAGFAIEEVARRHGDFAIAGAAVGVAVVDGLLARAAIALFGVDNMPRRADAAEVALVGAKAADADVGEIAQLAVRDLDPPDDLHASSALRRRIAAATVRRALARAIEEATTDA